MVKDKLAEILNFFDPIKLKDFEDSSYLNDKSSIGNNLIINSEVNPVQATTRFEIALIFVNQYIKPGSSEGVNGIQLIREELYRLKKKSSGMRIVDLGNLITGKNINETIFALQEVCALLFHLNVNIVVVGGSQLLTLGCFRALKEFENNINLVNVDSRIDLSSSAECLSENNYLDTIIEEESSHVYDIACVGYQTYFVDSKQLKRLNECYFEHYRLGAIRDNFINIEPVLRDADIVSFDISAVRMSEAPAQYDGSPNGFYADEACRLSRYAGLSDRNKLFGLYEFDVLNEKNRQTAKLSAQILWYFFDGFINRKHDISQAKLKDYTKYDVQIDEIEFPIVFYKSNKSNRWWIEVSAINERSENQANTVVSCTEEDYINACKNEIPERWWINFKKLK